MFGEEEDEDDAGLDRSMMGWRGVCAWDISAESSILLSSEKVVLVHFTEACRPSERFLMLETFSISPPPPATDSRRAASENFERRIQMPKKRNRGCIGCILMCMATWGSFLTQSQQENNI